jgi:large subunit ribosomal protein L17
MGHRDKTPKLGRTRAHREAMMANMASSLFRHRLIKTTNAKAKALKPLVDRLISTAKEDTLSARRLVAKTIRQKDVHKKLFTEIVPQFKDRQSGFSRIIKLGVRHGDGAPLSVVELLIDKPKVETDKKGKKKQKKSKKSKAAKATKAAKAAETES